ncbi:MAG: peptidase and in kexin sedolisin [Thermoleophilia bacterium]|nr:peptidase and in kexin sedolisin [Thermoleophilia bacterium]
MKFHGRIPRVVVAGFVVLASTGVAAAVADEEPASPPEIYRETTGAASFASSGFDGTGTTVAVIDTGVADVAGFDGKVIHQENLSSAPDAGDQFGHGTFVAGLVHRIAPGANIISVKLSDADGSVDVSQVIAALQWVTLHKDVYGIDVVNLSFGNDSRQSAYASPLDYAVEQTWDAGIVVVASAGNLGDESGTVTKPGDDPLIVSVGASNELGTSFRSDDTIPSFVSRGPTQDGIAKPDLVAPGTHVESLRAPGSTIDVANPLARVGTDGFRGSGTSFAAPIVAGVAAQVLGADPSLTPNQVKYGLLHGATAINGDPAAMGSGTVRASRTLTYARLGSANAGVQRSAGTGSLEGARGSAKVEVDTLVRTPAGQLTEVSVPLEGERTAEAVTEAVDAPVLPVSAAIGALDAFDNQDLRDPEGWDASHWGAGNWGDSQWAASHWGASHWGASHWGASHWGASQWWASHWG